MENKRTSDDEDGGGVPTPTPSLSLSLPLSLQTTTAPTTTTMPPPPSMRPQHESARGGYESELLGAYKARKAYLQSFHVGGASGRRGASMHRHRQDSSSHGSSNSSSNDDAERRIIDGLVCHSRNKIPGGTVVKTSKQLWEAALSKKGAALNPFEKSRRLRYDSMGGRGGAGHASFKDGSTSDVRACCAESLYKISCMEGNERCIIDSGAIETLIDFADDQDEDIQKYCAAVYVNLSTDKNVYDLLLQKSCLPAILELSWSKHILVKIYCATTLCRFSADPRLAEALIHVSATVELSAMSNVSNLPLQELCIRAICNLMAHGYSFSERLFLGVNAHGNAARKKGLFFVLSEIAKKSSMASLISEVIYTISVNATTGSAALACGIASILHQFSAEVTRQDKNTELHHWFVEAVYNFCRLKDAHAQFSIIGLKIVETVFSISSYECIFFMVQVLDYLTDAQEYCQQLLTYHSNMITLMVDLFQYPSLVVVETLFRIFTKMLIHIASSTLRNPSHQVLEANVYKMITCTAHTLQMKTKEKSGRQRDDIVSIQTTALDSIGKVLSLKEYDSIIGDIKLPSTILDLYSASGDSPDIQELCMFILCNCSRSVQLIAGLQTSEFVNFFVNCMRINQDFIAMNQCLLGSWMIVSQGSQNVDCAMNMLTQTFQVIRCFVVNSTGATKEMAFDVYSNDNGTAQSFDYTAYSGEFWQLLFEFVTAIAFHVANHHGDNISVMAIFKTWDIYQILRDIYDFITITLLRTSSTSFPPQRVYYHCVCLIYYLHEKMDMGNENMVSLLINIAFATKDAQCLNTIAHVMAKLSSASISREILSRMSLVGKLLNILGRCVDFECQYHAALTACNLSTVKNIWDDKKALESLIAIVILHTNASKAKEVYANALGNLLFHSRVRENLKDHQVVYALIKLSQLPCNTASNGRTVTLCLRSLLRLSNSARYHSSLFLHGFTSMLNAFLSAPSHLHLDGKCILADILCNLSFEKTNHATLLSSQTLETLQTLCVEGRKLAILQASMMSIRNFSVNDAFKDTLYTKRTIAFLVECLQPAESSILFLRMLILQILGNISSSEETYTFLSDLEICPTIGMLLELRTSQSQPPQQLSKTQMEQQEACDVLLVKILYNLGQSNIFLPLIVHGGFISLLSSMTPEFNEESLFFVAQIIHIITQELSYAKILLEQNVITLLVKCHEAMKMRLAFVTKEKIEQSSKVTGDQKDIEDGDAEDGNENDVYVDDHESEVSCPSTILKKGTPGPRRTEDESMQGDQSMLTSPAVLRYRTFCYHLICCLTNLLTDASKDQYEKMLHPQTMDLLLNLCIKDDNSNLKLSCTVGFAMKLRIFFQNWSVLVRNHYKPQDHRSLKACLVKLLQTFETLVIEACDASKIIAEALFESIVVSMYNFLCQDDLREVIVSDTGVELLIRIGQHSTNERVQQYCAMSLNKVRVSSQLNLKLGLVELLVSILKSSKESIRFFHEESNALIPPFAVATAVKADKMDGWEGQQVELPERCVFHKENGVTKPCKPVFVTKGLKKKLKTMKRELHFTPSYAINPSKPYQKDNSSRIHAMDASTLRSRYQLKIHGGPKITEIDLDKKDLVADTAGGRRPSTEDGLTMGQTRKSLELPGKPRRESQEKRDLTSPITLYHDRMKTNRKKIRKSMAINTLNQVPFIEDAVYSAMSLDSLPAL